VCIYKYRNVNFKITPNNVSISNIYIDIYQYRGIKKNKIILIIKDFIYNP